MSSVLFAKFRHKYFMMCSISNFSIIIPRFFIRTIRLSVTVYGVVQADRQLAE